MLVLFLYRLSLETEADNNTLTLTCPASSFIEDEVSVDYATGSTNSAQYHSLKYLGQYTETHVHFFLLSKNELTCILSSHCTNTGIAG